MAKFRGEHETYCWLCAKPANLETCKVDEDGRGVHEECYQVRAALKSTAKPKMVRQPPHRIAALWYLLCGLGKDR